MIARDELLKTLIAEGQNQLKSYTTSDDKNKELLRELIVQGLIKLFEADVVVAVRAKDVPLAEMVLKEANQDVSRVKVTLNKAADGMVSDGKAGGVILYAKQGKIVCDNTLDTRLSQIYYDLKPTVREMRFPTP